MGIWLLNPLIPVAASSHSQRWKDEHTGLFDEF